MDGRISRRTFVGSAAGAAACAAAAHVFSGPAVARADEEADASASKPSQLNPQDESWRGVGNDLSAVLSPWKLGPLELSHRIVKSAAGSATFLAGFGQELIDYYANFAKGGVEMIWVENFARHLTDRGGESPDWLLDLDLTPLVEECRKYGAHLGFQTYFMPAFSGVDHNAMTLEEIHGIQADIVNAATFLKEQGFEALEINAAGANLGAMFFSRANNHRDDEYGPQSFENRARFVSETIQQIKEACGADFVVQVLMNGVEEDDQNIGNSANVLSIEEGIEIAKQLEAAGADSFHIRLGALHQHVCQFAGDLYFIEQGIEGTTSYGTRFDFSQHWQGKVDGTHSGAGLTLAVAAEYKKALSVPVGTVSYLDPAMGPDFFNAAIADGKVDFFLMTRPLTVDTEYVNKLREGRLDEIAPCTRCVHCHIMGNAANAQYGYCRVNALTQRVYREGGPASYELPVAEGRKRVLVAGGGPAGMEAARIAALRGHDVTLCEKSGFLGGMLDFAAAIKGPHENLAQLKAYLERQLELAGVTVRLDTEVTPELVADEAPDALVVACGGSYAPCSLEGTTGTNVVAVADIASGEFGERVCVLGSNDRAVDCAVYLQNQGKKVTMVTADAADNVGKGQSNHEKEFILSMLYARGMRVWPEAQVKEVGDGEITVESNGITTVFACDTVLDASDMVPNATLAEAAGVAETYVIGDAKDPFNIALAIRGGNDAGRAL